MKARLKLAMIAAGLTLGFAHVAWAAEAVKGLPIDGMALGMTIAEVRKQGPAASKKMVVEHRKGTRGGQPRPQYTFMSDAQSKHTVPGDFWRVQLFTVPPATGQAPSDADQVLSVLASSESMQIPAGLTLAQLRTHYEKSFGPPATVWKEGQDVIYQYYEGASGKPGVGALQWDSIQAVNQMSVTERFCFNQRRMVRVMAAELSKTELERPGERLDVPSIEQLGADNLASLKACGRVAFLRVSLRELSTTSTVTSYVVETVDYLGFLNRLP